MPKAKKPTFDEFDSDVDEEEEDEDEEEYKPKGKNGAAKDNDDDDDDSDFEDPDDIEVPGGGSSLNTLKKGGKSNVAAGNRLKGAGVIKTSGVGANSLLRQKNAAAVSIPSTSKTAITGTSLLKTSAPSKAAIPLVGVDGDGIEVVDVVPGKPGMAKFNQFAGRGLPGSQSMARMTAAASSTDLKNSPYMSSLLAAQDPFFGMRTGSSSTGDLLQKSMQNGGLASLLQVGGMSGNATNDVYQALMASSMGGGALGGAAGFGGHAGLQATYNRMQQQQQPKANLSSLWLNNAYTKGGQNFMAGGGMYGQQGQNQQQDDEIAAEDEEDMGVIETYSNYMPSKLKIGKPHPDPVVETASMASVEPADVWYKLSMPQEVISGAKLSALQLESITYACQQHEQMLTDGRRAGFLIGDGAGVGKGRTIAGLMYENYCKGRKRAVWVSVSNDLKYDAERDLRDIGAGHIEVNFLSKMKYAKINSSINGNVRKGVIYATYSALIGESQGGGKYKTRLKQLLHWCGDDFDGLIVFDECHRAKNLCPSGAGKPTKTGQTVLELQLQLPKARIIYASATGASEPKHMAYMVRLGIWGPGSPFRDFNEFLGAVEKRGVGAMEIVAMDMKLRGMYIARQLSFQGVGFRIDEVEISGGFRRVYDESVALWVDLMHKFEEAAALVDAEKKMRKTMWGQFWSSHQRFFKYLCIASKVDHVVKTAREAIKHGKCVVIGLQSTGEARTLEAVEREGGDGELSDFVSTAKGVLQSLVEKHFPAPDRDKINRILGIGKPKTILDELGIKTENIIETKNGRPSRSAASNNNVNKNKRGARSAAARKKPSKYDDFDDSDSEGKDSDFEAEEEEEEEDDPEEEEEEEEEEDYEDDDDSNPFGSDSDEDDPWANRGRKRKAKNGKNGKGGKKAKKDAAVTDPFEAMLRAKLEASKSSKNGSSSKAPSTSASGLSTPMYQQRLEPKYEPPSQSNIDRACELKQEILKRIEKLGSRLPPNTLDHLIDELGGSENVAEMTGRKGRVVQDLNGDVRYESRSEGDGTPLERLNLEEKDRFMSGLKDVAIISEAASSGVSLQADRRVKNKKRRVHITLELPWSADRAIQQFGRTHRSNQVSAPEYILLISDLAGEHRFASIVAKRLESLGALTHGDRRATESRDLSRFNIDNKYGRAALESTFKAIMGYETPIVKPPSDYKGDFFKDIADGLVGVGLITQNEDFPGMPVLDKGYNDMSKFLNRILGLKVNLQNMLFRYFADTLNAIITQAKRAGRYDQGILDVGLSLEDHVELAKTHTFTRKHATGKSKIELHVLHVERGMTWDAAVEKWEDLVGSEEGFYLSHQVRNGKKTAILAAVNEASVDKNKGQGKGSVKKYMVYRPNTGQQVKQETLAELKKKYKKVSKDEAEQHWTSQFKSSAKTCSHAYWRGNCRNTTMGVKCEIGLRQKTYNVLAGSVLSVWAQVEEVLTYDGNERGSASKMQVVRLKLENNKRIVGTLIPGSAMSNLLAALSASSLDSGETIY